MDVRLVLAVQGLTGISAAECGVLVALASCRDHRTGKCCPSIATIAAMSHLSERSVIRQLSSLRDKRLLSISKMPNRHGEKNAYSLKVNDALLRVGECADEDGENAPLGDMVSPVTPCHPTPDTVSPPPLTECHPTHDTVSPKRYIKDSLKDSVCDGTLTQGENALCVQTVQGLAGEVPEGYVRWRFDELGLTGWTLADGRKVTREAFAAHVLAWWRNERDRGRWLKAEKAARLAASLTADDWLLCAERCARYGDCGCCAGEKIPPDKCAEHPCPPEECRSYLAKKGGVVDAGCAA